MSKQTLFAPCVGSMQQPFKGGIGIVAAAELNGVSYKAGLTPQGNASRSPLSDKCLEFIEFLLNWTWQEHLNCFLHLVMSIFAVVLLLHWLQLGLAVPVETPAANAGNTDDLAHTIAGFKTLQEWYNEQTGTWGGWWTSANQLTTVADFAYINPTFKTTVLGVFQNTFTQAPAHKVAQVKVNNATMVNTFYYPHIPASLGAPPAVSSGDWLNSFYDDEGWWALAWLKVYDITNQTDYLNAAIDIFDDMVKGYDATCGGIWWNKAHEANVAISNELFLAVAAQLARRASNKPYYLKWALKQWDWFYGSGLINGDGNINDGLDLKTCKNNNGIVCE